MKIEYNSPGVLEMEQGDYACAVFDYFPTSSILIDEWIQYEPDEWWLLPVMYSVRIGD